VPSPFVGIITATLPLIKPGFRKAHVARSRGSKNLFFNHILEPGKKRGKRLLDRPSLSWPKALREVKARLEPWILLQRYWRAWSALPLPLLLQQLLDALG
jgi:hypothetical protein